MSSARKAEGAALAEARRLLTAGSYRRAYETVRTVLVHHSENGTLGPDYEPNGTLGPDYEPNGTLGPDYEPADREEEGEVRSAGDDFVSLDPYEGSFMGRRLALAPEATLELEENGVRRALPSPRDLKGGDDVHATLRGCRVASLLARRGTATGPVVAMTLTTAFALPTLTLEGQPARVLSSVAAVRGRGEPPKPAACWLKVGPLPFKIGDEVSLRWNPRTQRIVEVRLAAPEAP
jgi:hypothetical protein